MLGAYKFSLVTFARSGKIFVQKTLARIYLLLSHPLVCLLACDNKHTPRILNVSESICWKIEEKNLIIPIARRLERRSTLTNFHNISLETPPPIAGTVNERETF
jgi:hypothetical protein